MTIEIAPAPAKVAPSKSSMQTASGRADSADRAAKPNGSDKAQGGEAKDPAGFLALLMGLGPDPVEDAIADPTAQASDAEELAPGDIKADLIAASATPVVTPPVPDTTNLPGMALPELSRLGARAGDKTRGPVDSMTLAVSDTTVASGRRRASPPADAAGPMGTQQLQSTLLNEAAARSAELAAAREGKPAAADSRLEAPPLQLPTSLQAPVAIDEARKGSHVGHAKVEVADNLVVLSSGLSGAMSAAGVADVGPPGSSAQFQSVVAQEVAYYISQDVQSAEMKLEGVGGGPVEVSINMQGKEAQVLFRTDELQTRDMLEGATAQLKEMLQQQGVVLTGVFVGSSGAGDSGQHQERRFRQGLRSETTLRIATADVRPQGASVLGVGRTLDLFV